MELTPQMVSVRALPYSTSGDENRQISGSPSGVPSPVLSFPPNNINFATTPRKQLRGKKCKEWQIKSLQGLL